MYNLAFRRPIGFPKRTSISRQAPVPNKDVKQLDRFGNFIATRKALLVDHFRKFKVLQPAAA